MAVMQKIAVKNVSITRANLLKLLTQMGKEKTLVAPVRNDVFGDVDFAFVKTGNEICFDYDNTASSPKEFFFPNCECMFSFEAGANESIIRQQVGGCLDIMERHPQNTLLDPVRYSGLYH